MRSRYLNQLTTPYLFGAVTDQVERHPNPVNLGVGDVSLPLPSCIVEQLQEQAALFGTETGFKGYGPEHGLSSLREKIAKTFYPMLSADEIFISDGAKTDIGRLQFLFDPSITIALQNPTYPTYKEAAILSGKTSFIDLPTLPSNNFFPQDLPKADLYIICSPHNPTGHALTRAQLQHLIDTARQHKSFILFDAAYASFIQDPNLVKTPYELEGAEEVVIEINSFSKLIGFTGLRLSWTVVPKKLHFRDGQSVHRDWSRLVSTYYNGTSRLTQAAGHAALSQEGLQAIHQYMQIYRQQAQSLKQALSPYFDKIYGAEHAPYLWIAASPSYFERMGIITIKGEGFGSHGQGFVRLSALGSSYTIQEAIRRCSQFANLSLT
ncbi:MAG: LL-diaminopimelate aminotransferase [Verrucomicrobia bacterium]|nr:LL-diaminopimelate aminotransferase [Verrucomicrobiota bacterium]MBS0646316.1 LL-diaminopimelate aminotransferase [Verrucomicrobiota bacterium]